MTIRQHRIPLIRSAALLASAVLTTATPGAIAAATPGAASAASAAPTAGQLRLTLPAPTGKYRLGTTALHLVDRARPDPWAPTPRARELKVQLWYPATSTAGHPAVPWMSPGEQAHLESDYFGIPTGRLAWPLTHGHDGAPADHAARHPVILYSHGSRGDRSFDTALVEELAGRGYVVATIDHTFDAGEVEFPDGRVEVRNTAAVHAMSDAEIVAVRTADTRFVLDRLTALAAGADPDAEHRPVPPGLAAALDLTSVGMFGHSMGGATTLQTLHDDPRVRAGATLDGPVFGTVATDGLAQPLLLMSSAWDSPARDAMWDALWPRLAGWRRQLNLKDSGHLSYCDLELLIPQGEPVIGWSAEQLDHFLGTGDGPRAVTAQRAYLRAFFDLQLRHRRTDLFAGPSPRYPEIAFTR
ncbi:alpha/beta hydrolase family protein [Kitasatospora sp. NPDC092948]|uniref:alpha/beta hydrolase family protein n=1 Tax=Kitasatospora sp. NPDC092948 TaxID=3364088 RepID=UPI003830281A